MGMAASQARFLGLTARKSNNEYQAQQINQERLALSNQQEELVKRYNEKMNNRILWYDADGDISTPGKQLTYWDIVNASHPTEEELKSGITAGMGCRLVDVNGNIIVPNYRAVDFDNKEISYVIEKYNIDETVKDTKVLQQMLEDGKWTLKAQRIDDEGNEYWFDLPLDEATFISRMRGENPDDETDTEYWQLFNTNVPKVNGAYPVLSYDNLTSMDNLKIQIYDEEGKVVVPEMPEEDMTTVFGKYYVDKYCVDPTYLEEKLRNGEWFIQRPQYTTNNETDEDIISDWSTVPWQGIEFIQDVYNSQDDAAAEAEYEYMMAKFHKQEKLLELRLQQLETEHKALETELDSVSKVLKDNVESSFKTFA